MRNSHIQGVAAREKNGNSDTVTNVLRAHLPVQKGLWWGLHSSFPERPLKCWTECCSSESGEATDRQTDREIEDGRDLNPTSVCRWKQQPWGATKKVKPSAGDDQGLSRRTLLEQENFKLHKGHVATVYRSEFDLKEGILYNEFVNFNYKDSGSWVHKHSLKFHVLEYSQPVVNRHKVSPLTQDESWSQQDDFNMEV